MERKTDKEIKEEKKNRMKRIENKAIKKFNLPYDDLTQEQQEWAENEIDIEDETEVWN